PRRRTRGRDPAWAGVPRRRRAGGVRAGPAERGPGRRAGRGFRPPAPDPAAGARLSVAGPARAAGSRPVQLRAVPPAVGADRAAADGRRRGPRRGGPRGHPAVALTPLSRPATCWLAGLRGRRAEGTARGGLRGL